MPRHPFLSLKVLLLVLVFIPLVHAQAPAPTQSTTVSNAGDAADESKSGTPTVEPTSSPTPAAPTSPSAVPTSKKNLSFEEAFNLGTQSYQTKKYEEAVQNFQQALALRPNSPSVLTDLGLSYYQLQKKGMAIAFFRRALYIDPSLPVAAAALKFTLNELETKEIPHQIETYERIRSSFLNSASLGGLHLLTALFLFTSGFIWLRYFGRRRKSFENEEAPPPIPTIGFVLALGFLLFLGLTLLKSYDVSIPRGTVVADKVSVQMAPGEGQNSLFELYAGFEVILRQSGPQDWLQVTYPGGLTGWVKKDTVMPSSGENAF